MRAGQAEADTTIRERTGEITCWRVVTLAHGPVVAAQLEFVGNDRGFTKRHLQ